MDETLGTRFAAAVGAKDRSALRDLLAEDVDFKGLTPGRSWEAGTSDEALEVLFGSWFEDSDTIESVTAEAGKPVGDTERVGYRFEIANENGPQVVEQQAYFRERDGRIVHLRVVCSGFRPRT